MRRVKLEIIFKRGLCTIARVIGMREFRPEDLGEDQQQKIVETEQFLERLLGTRVHIQQM